MKIHYFQRYHQKENVATANTMLLLSRLYHYSPNKFFDLLKQSLFQGDFEPELTFDMQKKSENSVPDAVIGQESFKIVVETKLSDWFYSEQLIHHLKAFKDAKHKVLLTLAPTWMATDKMNWLKEYLKQYNRNEKTPIIHIHTTFEKLISDIQDLLDERDFEMQDILDDYGEYCSTEGLIPFDDQWKWLRVRLTGTTYDFNFNENVYYDGAQNSFRPFAYLGLYKNKSVRAIGKVIAQICAVEENGILQFKSDFGELTPERKDTIVRAIKDAEKYGYDLHAVEHRYFFVERFYETDFKKSTKYPPRGPRNFDLTTVLSTNDLPSVPEIANLLREKTWE